MSRLDDPRLVAEEYADESRLRRRASIYAGRDAKDDVVAAVAEVSPRRVLEVGCGWGELAERVATETEAEVVAVDISPRMVELTRQRGIDARVGDVQKLPFADGEFDVVVAVWMLYHVPDIPRALGEIVRVLRPGGRLVAATNSQTHLHELRELVGSGPSPISFTRESGEKLLAPFFAQVRRIDDDGTTTLPRRADVEDYVRASIAMFPFVENLPAEVAEPFVATRACSVFVAET
jgi:ubiquinone/menaquinone biosynthesis C-methylase UbiE